MQVQGADIDMTFLKNARRSPDVDTMLGQPRRRWISIVPSLGVRLVFAD